MKFGGTSVGSPERLARVVEIVAAERARGKIAVVVSAMGDSTDVLIDAAGLAAKGDLEGAEHLIDKVADLAITNGLLTWQSIAGGGKSRPAITPAVRKLMVPLREVLTGLSLIRERTAQTLDLVMSFGERLSATVLTELVEARGVPAVYADSRTWTVTDDRFGAAYVDWQASAARLASLREGWGDRVPVNTGFLGQTPDGRTTTLGRNGSDYTATLLARGIGADEVIIWTDVPGVMTADPGIVADAYPIAHLTYNEALELASYGARMFHPRTMIPLIASGISMRIKNTMAPELPGTRIDGAVEGDRARGPTSVTSLENLALAGVRWQRLSQQAQMGERVLRALEAAGVTVWMASQSAHGQAVAVVFPAAQISRAERAIEEELTLERERGEVEPISIRQPVTLLSLVAETMGRGDNVAGRFFDSLGAVGVQVLAIAQGASSRSISCAIPAENTATAVRSVHAAFNFAHQEVNLLLLGKGNVASSLLAQIHGQHATLERDHDLRLRVVGLCDRAGWVFDERGLELSRWPEVLDRRRAAHESEIPLALLDRLRGLPVPIVVDCTAADGMEALYEAAFERGVHVAAANKKPLAVAWPRRETLMAAARRHHRAYCYETTVGASLPVIETLKNLVRTGDRVLLIEGSFSGTLGYLTTKMMDGVPLSEAVRTAHALGYTEPRPQEDLSGMDVARKALILARELGLPLSIADMVVEPLVPEVLILEPSVERFMERLAEYDAAMADRLSGLRAEGRVLRYLARIEPEGPRVSVGPLGVPGDHPAARLRGAEAFVAFTTDRYREYPLVVQGAGAGGAVTAAGVLADVLRIAQTLRGR